MAKKHIESRLKAPLGRSIKWWMRYHRDNPREPVTIANPSKFLSAHQRAVAALRLESLGWPLA